MEQQGKIILTVLGVGAAAVAVASIFSLKQVKDNLNIVIAGAKLHKINLEGIEFRADVTLQNPTKNTLSITQPFVKLLQSDMVIASTKVDATVFDLQPLSEMPLHTISLKMSWTNIFGLITSAKLKFPNTVNTLLEKITYCIKNSSKIIESLNLYMEYSTYANNIFFKSKERIGGTSVSGMTDDIYIASSLGVTAAYQRVLANEKKYDYLITNKLLYQDKIIIPDGSVVQTVELMQKVVHKYLSDTKKIAPLLHRANTFETCKAIWNFTYNHIQYKEDQLGLEQIRRPARAWSDRETGIDCDCFSVFISSILTNLQIPHQFRITEYDHKGYFQHVYVVVPYQNKYITIDCVLDKFNQEKPFTKHKDFNMSLKGIDIAVLNSPNSEDDVTLFGLGSLDGLTNEQATTKGLKELHNHLVFTRNEMKKNSSNYKNLGVDAVKAQIQMITYAIDNWNTNKRGEALQILADNEDKMNAAILQGFEDEQLGRSVRATTRKENRITKREEKKNTKATNASNASNSGEAPKKKGFFNNIKEGVKALVKDPKNALKDIAQVIKKTNPVLAASRNSFLLLLKVNLFRMSSKLKWGYANEAQAKAGGQTTEQWQKSVKAVQQFSDFFEKAGGNPDNIKKEVLRGKRALKGMEGIEDNGYDLSGFLGNPGLIPAAIVAASPFLIKAKKILSDLGLFKKKDEEFSNGTDENYNEDESNESIDNAVIASGGSPEQTSIIKTEDEIISNTEAGNESGTGFFDKVKTFVTNNPIPAAGIGLAAVGATVLIVKAVNKPKPIQKYATNGNGQSKSFAVNQLRGVKKARAAKLKEVTLK